MSSAADEQAGPEASADDEVTRSLQQAMRTLRNQVDRLDDLDPAQRAEAAQQLVDDAAELDNAIATAAEADSRHTPAPGDDRD